MAVARGAHAAAIRERGLIVEAPDGTAVAPLAVAPAAGELAPRPGDVVLVAVKTQDVTAVVDDLVAAGFADTPVACLTNGLEAERACARQMADVHAVCVMSPCEHLEPGVVRQWAEPPLRGILDVGRYPEGDDAVDARIAEALRAAGYRSDPLPDILRWKRTKLLLNLGNAIEAMAGPAARGSALAAAARAEAIAVFAAARLAYASEVEDAARRVGLRSDAIGGATRKGGSTWQSLARGKPLETDYLNGEIVLLGKLHGVATPVNARIQRAVRLATEPGALALDAI